MKPSTVRLGWVDIYKGIAILLIVVGHTWSPLTRFVYLFHVPAFFLISGYTTNFVRDSFPNFFRRRVRSLLIPYLTICLSLIGFYALVRITLGSTNLLQSQPFSTLGALRQFVISGLPPVDLAGAAWFLIVIFMASIALKLVHDITRDMRHGQALGLLTVIAAASYSFLLYHYGVLLPYNLDLVPLAALFMQIGVLIKQYNLFERLQFWPSFIVSVSILSYGSFVTFFPMDWPSRQFAALPIIVTTALAGSYLLFIVSRSLAKLRFRGVWEYIGRNSLAILAFQFLMFKPTYLALAAVGHVPLAQVAALVPLNHTNHYWWLLTIVSVGFCLLLAYYINFSKPISELVLGRNEPSRLPSWLTLTTLRRLKLPAIGILIILVTLATQHWVLAPQFGFYFDDYDWLAQAATKSYGQILHVIPQQSYNDRPVGAAFIKLLYDLFGLNAVAHHAVLLALHALNGLLVAFVVSRILGALTVIKQRSTIAVSSALIFVAWPVSTIFIGWDAAIFDTLGATLLLSALALYLAWRKKTTNMVWRGIVIVVIFALALRTKEMTITLPVQIILIELVVALHAKVRPTWNGFISWRLIGPSLLLVPLYLISLMYASHIHPQNFPSNSPYFLSHNPLVALRNLYYYAILYLDPTLSSNSYVRGTGHIVAVITGVILAVVLALSAVWRRRQPHILLALVLTAVSISPVLFLANNTQRLYLYVPSIYAAFAIALILSVVLQHLPARQPFISQLTLGLVLVGLTAMNHLPNIKLIRSYYINTIGVENTRVLKVITAMPRPMRGQKIVIINVSPRSQAVYPFMPRYGTIRPFVALTQDESLRGEVHVDLGPSQIDTLNCSDCYIVNYNNGDPLLVQSK